MVSSRLGASASQEKAAGFLPDAARRTGDSRSESPWASWESTSDGGEGLGVVHIAGRRVPGKVGRSSLADGKASIWGWRGVTSVTQDKWKLHHPPLSRLGIATNSTSGKPGAWAR